MAKPPPPSVKPSPIDPSTAAAAVDALISWLNGQQKHRKAQLLDHDEPIQLLLSLRRIPASSRTNPYLLPLPHPLHPDPSVCILLPDIRASAIEPLPFSSAPKLIPISSLRSDYASFEARRRLASSFDLFFADRRIISFLPRLLGKTFFKKKRHPLKVNTNRKDLISQIRRGCSSSRMYVSTGTCVHLDIGRVSMSKDQILENLSAVVEGAISKVPKGWKNVRGMYLKLEQSVALPIYQVLPNAEAFKIDVRKESVEAAEESEEKEAEVESEEIEAAEESEEKETTDIDGHNPKKKKKEEKKKKKKKKKKTMKKVKLGEVRYMDVECAPA